MRQVCCCDGNFLLMLCTCNHAPLQPLGWAVDSRGNEQCFYFCIVPTVRAGGGGGGGRQCNEGNVMKT